MDIAKTLRNANEVFDRLNPSVEASDLKRVLATERKFREYVCNLGECSEEQRPHLIRIMTHKVRTVIWLAGSHADAKSVTDWILA